MLVFLFFLIPASYNVLIACGGTINGPINLCPNEVGTYTFSEQCPGNPTGYYWNISSGAYFTDQSGVLNLGTNVSHSGPVYVLLTSDMARMTVDAYCSPSGQSSDQIDIFRGPTPPVILGSDIVCVGISENYAAVTVPGATGYRWSISSGTIFNPYGQQVTVSASSAQSNVQLCVYATGQNCDGAPNCKTLQFQNQIPYSTTISGPSGLSYGATGIYSIP